jgi:hypothetical protein
VIEITRTPQFTGHLTPYTIGVNVRVVDGIPQDTKRRNMVMTLAKTKLS